MEYKTRGFQVSSISMSAKVLVGSAAAITSVSQNMVHVNKNQRNEKSCQCYITTY
uniref:Secreted protein n=1 Tax=Heterorhabditis bacteriophora TaxID=37862 RepID=A0A1I7XEL3_HETBA